MGVATGIAGGGVSSARPKSAWMMRISVRVRADALQSYDAAHAV